ncbi:chemotaxis protein CheW [Halostagnicola sp. A56]|uniref:chemotaxis protein CheW n=1 Tax=Halostagnicola sp. A56 TaxID=1495067 RepID=UPI00049F5A44|nr:chemotaxis protein CheW [Halostagnicola sp. A56]
MAAKEYEQGAVDEGIEETNERDAVDVLEFELDTDGFCVEIGYIAEIVNCGELTNLPSTPAHIEGVLNLREEAVKVINLKRLLEVGEEYTDEKLIVFKRKDGADSRLGWLVDGVRGVHSFPPSEVEAGGDEPGVEGVIRQGDDFVIWLDPARMRI